MNRRPLPLLLSATGWAGFTVVMAWAAAFLAGIGVPGVDGPARTGTATAVAVDLSLLGLFAVQHSVMARRSVKARLRTWVPEPLERTVFVLASDLCLGALLLGWQPFGGDVWHVSGAAAGVLLALCAAGWVLAVAATYAVDHLELFGLRQTGWGRRRLDGTGRLEVGGLYAVVRHPLMTGLLVAFWAAPRMGASHLLFAVASTGYVLVGVAFEERDLRRTFGAAYDEYAARVPALLPRLLPRRRPAPATQRRTDRTPAA